MLSKHVFLTIFLLFFIPVSGQQNQDQSERTQFDFWVGKWRVEWYNSDGELQHGTNTVRKILKDQVIEENFDGNPSMAFEGKSFSVYSPMKKKWQQTWVDDSGGYLDFTGEFTENQMKLERSVERNGNKINQRMIFYNISENSIDWNWEISNDGGKTFELKWKIHYTRLE